MKNIKKWIEVLFFMILFLALLVGCGRSPLTGRFLIKTYDGMPIEEYLVIVKQQAGDETPLEEYYKEIGIRSAEEFMTIEFKKDGTLITKYAGLPAENQPPVRSWEQIDDKIIISIENGTSAEAVLNGNELKWKNPQGQEFVFIRDK